MGRAYAPASFRAFLTPTVKMLKQILRAFFNVGSSCLFTNFIKILWSEIIKSRLKLKHKITTGNITFCHHYQLDAKKKRRKKHPDERGREGIKKKER